MLLEREAGLARVHRALDAAGRGESSLMLVTGPLGIGRTAFLQQLPALAGAGGTRVLRANAALMEQDFAFGVVRQLFDSLLAAADEDVRARWLERADRYARLVFSGDGDGEEAAGAASAEAILHGLRALLVEVSRESRLLVLVDDLQWVDAPSLRWLAYLAKRLHQLRVLLVCTLRDGDPRARHSLVREVAESAPHTLRLAPLSEDATRRMVAEQFGEEGDDAYVTACHEVSAGNPLFLMSVLLGMAVSGHPPTAEAADTARTLRPSELRERLAGCLRTQPAPVRDLAAAIAVFGDRGDPELITRLAALDEIGCTAALRALHQLGLLGDDREPRFVHRVVEDAVESSMTAPEWERLHASAAALLYRSGRPAEQVAAQLMFVTSAAPDWAPVVLRSAADTALRRGAPEIAARYLLRALLYSPGQNEERARLLIDLATAERAFDTDACERHIGQAVPLLSTVKDRAAAVLRVPPTLLSRPSGAITELLRQTSEVLQHEDGDGSADPVGRELALRIEARQRHYGQENPVELAAAVDRLRALGKEPPLDSAAQRELAGVLLCAAALSGRVPASEVAGTANRILDREPATSTRPHPTLPLTVLTLYAADSLDAIGAWLAAGSRARREQATPENPLWSAQQALLLVAGGRPAKAREYAERALRTARPDWRDASAVLLAAVAVELRDPALSERVIALADRHRHLSLALTALLRLLHASLDAQQGRQARALESLLACGRQLEASGWRNSVLFPWRPRAIGLYEELGDSRSALVLADEEHAWAGAWGAPAALGRALRLKGRLHGERGLPLLRQAVGVLRGSANELELARALALLGEALPAGEEADAALREAAELAAVCGAAELIERAGQEAPAAAPEPRAALTPSELRVLAFVARGSTNQEIAKELGVSLRAVEKHLTNSYRKLGLSGRHEVAEMLADTDALRAG